VDFVYCVKKLKALEQGFLSPAVIYVLTL